MKLTLQQTLVALTSRGRLGPEGVALLVGAGAIALIFAGLYIVSRPQWLAPQQPTQPPL